MSERLGVELTRAAVGEHDAARAWARLGLGSRTLSGITVLREGRKTAAYRLHGVGPSGRPVIAKRCRRSTLDVERVVYEHVLAGGAGGTLRSFGWLEMDGASWLFLEDAGGRRFSTAHRDHRLLAARWLALLPLAIRDAGAARTLPDASAARYLAQLRSAREMLRRGAETPSRRPTERRLLDSVIAQLDRLESRWDDAVECCALAPPTFVHGDLQPKNMRVRGDEGIVVMDWETAGWGTPAVDLAFLAGPAPSQDEIDAYRAAARERGIEHDAGHLRRLVETGTILRRIAAIEWDVAGLTTAWPQRSLACTRVYHSALAEAMGGAAWAR